MPRDLDRAKLHSWRRRLQEFERGSATIGDFCRRAGVTPRCFYYWRHKVRCEAAAAASEQHRDGTAIQTRRTRFVRRFRRARIRRGPQFLPVEITDSRRAAIDVHLPNGARVTIACHQRDAIAAVIAALRSDAQECRPC